jgi:PAS domain S-box-containing protein
MPIPTVTGRAFVTQWLLLISGLLLFGATISFYLADRLWFAEENERGRLLGQARVIRDNLQNQLAGTNQALLGVLEDVARLEWDPRELAGMNIELDQLCDSLPGVRTLTVIDARGLVRFSSRPGLIGIDVTRKVYFRRAIESGDADRVFLTPPYETVLGVWAMNMVRVVLDEHGAFGGIVVATLDPEYFKILMRSVNYTEDMWTALAHEEGVQFLMEPARPGQTGKDLAKPGSFFSRFVASGEKEMVSTGGVLATGETRMVAITMIDTKSLSMDRTLVIAASRDLAAITAYWREDVWVHSIIFTVVALSSVLALLLFHRRQRRHFLLEATAEIELKESEGRFRTVFRHSSEAMLVMVQGRFIDCNGAALDMLGLLDRTALIGRRIEDLSPSVQPDGAQSRDKAARMISLAADHGAHVFEWTHVRPSGEIVLAEVVLTSIRLNDGPAFHVALRNITRRKEDEAVLLQAKEELEQTVRERTADLLHTVARLEEALDAAEEASRSKSEFLANMSHELRTPINGIVGMLHLLQQTGLNSEQEEYATMAIQAITRLTALISDILDLSRVEAGKMPLRSEPFDLLRTFEQVIDLLEPVARQVGVALRRRLGRELDRVVRGDAVRVQQVITNLLGNAFKFTPAGSVTVEACLLRSFREGTIRVLFSVSDTGVGIADAKLEELFEPFVQGSVGFTRPHQGAGLGLSIVKHLVDLMGGSLCVESEVGAGTTFHVCLVFEVAKDQAVAAPDIGARADALPLPRRILLAEDDHVSAIAASRQLEKAGCSVRLARDGFQVLAALEEQPFDLVLMDIQMPGMDGMEAAKRIRESQADYRDIPIIALTAYAMTGDREKFMVSGMNGYVSKPVEMEALRLAMVQVVAKSPATGV